MTSRWGHKRTTVCWWKLLRNGGRPVTSRTHRSDVGSGSLGATATRIRSDVGTENLGFVRVWDYGRRPLTHHPLSTNGRPSPRTFAIGPPFTDAVMDIGLLRLQSVARERGRRRGGLCVELSDALVLCSSSAFWTASRSVSKVLHCI